jgi:hypothetical protein
METRQVEFAKLRYAYLTVKAFTEENSSAEIKSLNDKIKTDLGLSGDDNLEFLEEFVKKFELDYKDFDYKEHFHTEGELFDSLAALLNLLTLSVWLPLKTIELITLNKIHLDKPKFPVTPDRVVSDLTFKELLTWYLEKEYKPKDMIRYELKISRTEI